MGTRTTELPKLRVRAGSIFLGAAALSGCAMQRQVQRETVEYNTAVSGMANQLTLLNIARARQGLPTFYTSVSRLSGSILVKAAAGFGAQIKADQPVSTSSTTHQVVAGSGTSGSTGTTIGTSTSTTSTTGATTSATDTLTTVAQQVLTRGGNVYAPSISGEIDSGPSFDIQILDTQQFYRGILSGIDGPTLLNLIDQGVNEELILRLLVYKVVFKAAKKSADYDQGQVVRTWTNPPLGEPGTFNGILAQEFWPIASCYVLASQAQSGGDTRIASVRRVTMGNDGSANNLRLADLSALDGSELALATTDDKASVPKKDVYVGSAATPDDTLVIVKPAQSKEVVTLVRTPDDPGAPDRCLAPDDRLSGQRSAFFNGAMFVPGPEGKGVLKIYQKGTLSKSVDVKAEIVPRSTEAVVQYLGAYTRFDPASLPAEYRIHGRYLFLMRNHCRRELVGVELTGRHYCIDADDEADSSSMQVLSLVEQLIDLNKSGADRPTTVPVQVIP